jgi:selenocysteine lyase/cysteine desulfurase
VRTLADGRLDEDDLDRRLAEHAGRVVLLAVTAASNVTGVVPPIHRLAEQVHAAGGRILVDAAQLAAHRPIDMRPHDDPGHLDFVAVSAHKMYAPFGSGAIIGARAGFGAVPDHRGGGTVTAVTDDDVSWADLPDRAEAGSPNVVGAVALAAAVEAITAIGWDRIVAHEAELLRHASQRLAGVPAARAFGPPITDTGAAVGTDGTRVGVIPFNLDRIDHGLVAAILGYEHGIGVRHGCFCAHPYVIKLLGLDTAETDAWVARVRNGDKRSVPGMVRISIGCYNDTADIDRAVDALARIAAGDVSARYVSDAHGEFTPV